MYSLVHSNWENHVLLKSINFYLLSKKKSVNWILCRITFSLRISKIGLCLLPSSGLSAHLFPRFELKKGFWKKPGLKLRLVKSKTQLLSKLRFGHRPKTRTKREKFMDLWGSINENAHCAFDGLTLLMMELRKYPWN